MEFIRQAIALDTDLRRQLLQFGDTDSDGELSDSEMEKLLQGGAGLPVPATASTPPTAAAASTPLDAYAAAEAAVEQASALYDTLVELEQAQGVATSSPAQLVPRVFAKCPIQLPRRDGGGRWNSTAVVVEHLPAIDWRANVITASWRQRAQLAVHIMEYMLALARAPGGPLYACDLHLGNLASVGGGEGAGGAVKVVDVDALYNGAKIEEENAEQCTMDLMCRVRTVSCMLRWQRVAHGGVGGARFDRPVCCRVKVAPCGARGQASLPTCTLLVWRC